MNAGIFSQMFKQPRQAFAIFVPIYAETWLILGHQENVGNKKENGKKQEEAAGSHLKKLTFEEKRNVN